MSNLLLKFYMLEKLFGSKARVKILKLFLTHSEEKFYIRQIARKLKLQLNSVRRELAEVQERLDFAERMLLKGGEHEHLGAPRSDRGR